MLQGLQLLLSEAASRSPSFFQHASIRSFATGSNKLQLIKSLRERTGSPISDVKAALDEAEYDAEGAYQVLRKKGLAAASKKASRHAAEGLVGFAARDEQTAVLVEINSETDFVANNDQFRQLVLDCAQTAANLEPRQPGNHGLQELDRGDLGQSKASSHSSIDSAIAEVAGTVRENIRLRRAFRLIAPNGVISSYLHVSPAPGLGRIGALVALQGKNGPIPASSMTKVQDLGTKLAMHAAASSPLALDRESVPPNALEEEEAILREQLAKTRKPPNIHDKIIAGKMNKFFEERCFLDQSFIMDDSQKVKEVLKELSKSIDTPISLTGFLRLQVGEGLENEGKKDFASEVEQTLRQTG